MYSYSGIRSIKRTLSFKSDDTSSLDEAISAMKRCVSDLRNWMIRDRLMINDDKTELILIGTRQQLGKINDVCNISVGEYDIYPYYLHKIRRIKKYFFHDSLLTLIHAFITSSLDYCNGLLYSLPKLQNYS